MAYKDQDDEINIAKQPRSGNYGKQPYGPQYRQRYNPNQNRQQPPADDPRNNQSQRNQQSRPPRQDVYSSAPRNGNRAYYQDDYQGRDFDDYDVDLEPQTPPTRPGKPPKRKKKSRGKRVVAIILIILVLLGIAGGAYAYKLLGSINYNPSGHKSNVYIDESTLYQSKKVENILFIGVDRRSSTEKESRSDTMMLVSIDKANKKIKMTSFMRDNWVYIPDRASYHKLNSACTYGGAQLVMDTIEYNFNVNIDHYALVDFNIFQTIVNNLGGITVEVTPKEAKYLQEVVHLDVSSGNAVTLNGKEALWYCRIRYLDSDFMRTQRQRKVLSAIIAKAKQTNVIDLSKTFQKTLPLIETDLSKKDVAKIGIGTAFSYMHYDVEQMRMPTDDAYTSKTINGMSVLSLDFDKNKKALYDFLYQKDAQ